MTLGSLWAVGPFFVALTSPVDVCRSHFKPLLCAASGCGKEVTAPYANSAHVAVVVALSPCPRHKATSKNNSKHRGTEYVQDVTSATACKRVSGSLFRMLSMNRYWRRSIFWTALHCLTLLYTA